MSDASLIKNIEILISKGAKPNIVVSISGSTRKAGTYIPAILIHLLLFMQPWGKGALK